MTYKDAYDKIIQAYFKDEIEPSNARFCFCGTLEGGNTNWYYEARRGFSSGNYTVPEYRKMEEALFSSFPETSYNGDGTPCLNYINAVDHISDYEGKLFKGMCAALEVLKEIHRSRGENVDSPELTKRVLTT